MALPREHSVESKKSLPQRRFRVACRRHGGARQWNAVATYGSFVIRWLMLSSTRIWDFIISFCNVDSLIQSGKSTSCLLRKRTVSSDGTQAEGNIEAGSVDEHYAEEVSDSDVFPSGADQATTFIVITYHLAIGYMFLDIFCVDSVFFHC